MRAVILTAYGSPAGPSDVERYYTKILGGRKPPAPLLEDLKARYAAIGGISPLTDITFRQAEALQQMLSSLGSDLVVKVGMKYSPPFIEDTVSAMSSEGITDMLVLPLTPFNSSVGIESYLGIAKKAAASLASSPGIYVPGPWHVNSHFVECWKHLISAELKVGERVIFTAHSIPRKYVEAGEPYRDQISELAALLSADMGIGDHELAFQSAGRSGEEWIGPDLAGRIDQLGREGVSSALIVPVGFVSAHLEVLYDIDIEAVERASRAGVSVRRTDLPNDNELFIRALADVCLSSAREMR